MRTKYFEERLGDIYFEFGVHPDGRVDIASGRDDIVATVTKEHANKLIADRHQLLKVAVALAKRLHQADPQAWDDFYVRELDELLEDD